MAFLARDQTAYTNLFKINVISDNQCFIKRFEQVCNINLKKIEKDFDEKILENSFLARGQTADPNPSKKQKPGQKL